LHVQEKSFYIIFLNDGKSTTMDLLRRFPSLVDYIESLQGFIHKASRWTTKIKES